MKVCPICKNEYPGGELFCPADGARLGVPSGMEGESVAPAPPSDPLLGQTLQGRYKIRRRIGEGGMGIVYEAEHVLIEKRVALKVLRDDFSSRPDVVERFRQEAKSASRIGHENIVDISDFGETPSGASYFVMEFLVGEDLASVLAKTGVLSAERAAKILLQCCRALGAAHAKGIVHRDMKPENIFLTDRDGNKDFVKIVDFGIAKMSDIETKGEPGRKLTKTGMIFGTPEYMSPEQAAGKSLDHRVDIYAVGVIFFELLTGRVPFVGDTFMGILTQHMFDPPPGLKTVNSSVQVSPEVEAVIQQALSKDPAARFQTMEELARAILKAVDMSSAPELHTFSGYVPPARPLGRGPKVIDSVTATPTEFPQGKKEEGGSSSGKMLAIFGGAATLALLGAGGYYMATRDDEPIAQDRTPDAGGVRPIALVDSGFEIATAITDAGPRTSADAGQMIQFTVFTSPRSARVERDGTEMCATTPCSFETPYGVQIHLKATAGNLYGETDLIPGPHGTNFTLPLVRRTGGGNVQTPSPNTTEPPPTDPPPTEETNERRGTPEGLKAPPPIFTRK